MNWGNGRGCVSVIHSPAECRATAHQETVFQFFTGKSGCLLNPFRRPAHIPQPAGCFPRHFKRTFLKTFFKTFVETFVETFLYKTFCNRHTVFSAPAGKRPGILPGCEVLISE
ncbi:hypothetical protein IVU49_26340 [Salmonella enterica subsp. enterica serovar Worthington]|nr:hypothetical protein [Salmonella enterica subsp. enterica serovar Worthington]MBP1523240.1 hypothetical protein [Salmonella enterica subsp. enterica serovar Worthington]